MDVLRVHIITEEDPFYIPVFFREFFQHLPSHQILVTGVDITPPLNQRSRIALARRLVRFYGLKDFAKLAGRFASARMKDFVIPLRNWDGTVRRLALRHGVPCGPVANVNAPDYVRRVADCRPDVILSVAASQIFRPALLRVPRLGCVNVHTGKLPQYRGMLPVFWQMHDGCSQIGVTVHTMTEGIDLGEIILESAVAVNQSWTLDAAIREMKKLGAGVVLDALERLRLQSATPTPMDHGTSGYRSFPGPDDAREFRRRGLRLL